MERCPVCSSFSVTWDFSDEYNGTVYKCWMCGFTDYIDNPFHGAVEFFSIPSPWCLVWNLYQPIA